MNTMHEALAREHMRQLEGQAREHRLTSRAGPGRWHYLRTAERRARRAHQRSSATAARSVQHSHPE